MPLKLVYLIIQIKILLKTIFSILTESRDLEIEKKRHYVAELFYCLLLLQDFLFLC